MSELEQIRQELADIKAELDRTRRRAIRLNDAAIVSVTLVGIVLALFINFWAVPLVFLAGVLGFAYRTMNTP